MSLWDLATNKFYLAGVAFFLAVFIYYVIQMIKEVLALLAQVKGTTSLIQSTVAESQQVVAELQGVAQRASDEVQIVKHVIATAKGAIATAKEAALITGPALEFHRLLKRTDYGRDLLKGNILETLRGSLQPPLEEELEPVVEVDVKSKWKDIMKKVKKLAGDFTDSIDKKIHKKEIRQKKLQRTAGWIAGGLTGAGLGLLYAPRSGKNTRELISEGMKNQASSSQAADRSADAAYKAKAFMIGSDPMAVRFREEKPDPENPSEPEKKKESGPLNAREILTLLKGAYEDWKEDKAPRLGAALAYYSIFSLAPLLLIVIAIAGLVFGREAAQGQIVNELSGMLGPESAKGIEELIQNSWKPKSGLIATAIGLVTLLLGATGVFGQLQEALDTIWEIPEKKSKGLKGVITLIKDRFLSFTMVLGIGFLLLISLVIAAGVTGFGKYMGGLFPAFATVIQVLNIVVSFGVVTLLFAMMYKILPEVQLEWRDVWFGAGITAFLFTIGKFAIGFYLAHSTVGSTFGAAGSLVVILIWIYYSAQIFLFGAEFTQVYAKRRGSWIEGKPKPLPKTTQ